MMHGLAINRDDGKVRGAARGSASVCGFGSHAPIDHHKVTPERLQSLPAGGRSLRGGCAVRRQTGARAGGNAGTKPAIRPTRLLRYGWYFAGPMDFLEADRLIKAGVDSRVAAQLIANHSTAPGSVQGIAERLPVHLTNPSFRVEADANENGLMHAQILFAPGAKAHD